MKKLNINELRKEFLDFFELKKDHIRLKSYSLVPNKDKSLLLINAGMAPLKEYFVGTKKFQKNRATSSQKCLRTGDIDNVGKTHRHGTFFEMLGNFSFGDYFKKEAIQWAWEFLTEVIELDPEKMSVTVYQDDDEAYDIWHKVVGLPEDKIKRLGKEDNFWEIEEGPCGPCSEIMYDRGPQYEDPEDRYLEIWNLVFTQFNKDSKGNYIPLEHPNIDTGMGLERLGLIVENANNIFELKTFKPILDEISNLSGKKYGEDAKFDESFRVIMDHSKAMTFLVFDGVIPSNEGRGYVLRRLIRRAYRHGKHLGIKGNFLTKLVEKVMTIYNSEYPEVLEDKERVMKIIRREEDKFQETIDQGLEILNNKLEMLKSENKKELSGEDAFKLYDTYGFPLDLTEEIAKDMGISIDKDGFKNAMQIQKEKSRSNKSFEGGWEEDKITITGYDKTIYVGDTNIESESKIIGIEGLDDNTINEGEKAIVVLDITPFYGESGGQIGDTGYIESNNGLLRVLDTKKTADEIYYCFVECENGEFSVGDEVVAKIDADRRNSIRKNHSATHLLNKALKTVLGTHINQAGSLVTDERLRFDFTHFEAISDEDLSKIEQMVNKSIFDNYKVNIQEMSLKESQEMGAVGLFEDKYKDVVRVVDMGGYSTELCGGSHVNSTSEVMMFKILSESGIAAGVRRIEAITGLNVYNYLNKYQEKEERIANILKTKKENIEEKINSTLENEENMKSIIETYKSLQENRIIESIETKISTINDVNTLIVRLDDIEMDLLKNISDKIQNKNDNIIVLLSSVINGKIIFVSSVSPQLIKRNIKAGEIVRFVAQNTGGNGGGRPDFAQAGGKDIDKLDEALKAAADFITDKLQ
ncbi:alanine--tRNA ligase [Helcococcus kunzii]|uniref:alanine--tRNA ligase n=1 Tax=Helcococcus kunzii TaxID=40091 RepID=UPI001BB02818|nr:alanine--tRNA ligase [Helcococcus kunzii]QUY64825.1 alanine--tRNA ligase [Helcococcus kunzii]